MDPCCTVDTALLFLTVLFGAIAVRVKACRDMLHFVRICFCGRLSSGTFLSGDSLMWLDKTAWMSTSCSTTGSLSMK